MRYRGKSTNRPAERSAGPDGFTRTKSMSCPIGRPWCSDGKEYCPRFGRVKEADDEIVCIDVATEPTTRDKLQGTGLIRLK